MSLEGWWASTCNNIDIAATTYLDDRDVILCHTCAMSYSSHPTSIISLKSFDHPIWYHLHFLDEEHEAEGACPQSGYKWWNKNLCSSHVAPEGTLLAIVSRSLQLNLNLNSNGILDIHCMVFWFAKHCQIFTVALHDMQGYSVSRKKETERKHTHPRTQGESEKSGVLIPLLELSFTPPRYGGPTSQNHPIM